MSFFGIGGTTCNMFTGKGFDLSILGGFSMAWIGAVIIFFIMALAKKWVFEELMGTQFSLVLSLAVGYILYLGVITFTCSPKIAIVISLIAGLIGGWIGGTMELY